MRNCGFDMEINPTFHLRFQNDKISRSKLLKNVYNRYKTQRNNDDGDFIHALLYVSAKFNFNPFLIWNLSCFFFLIYYSYLLYRDVDF